MEIEKLQEYKELYYKETEYSETMNSKIGTSISIITLIGSSQIYIWTKIMSLEIIISPLPIIFFIISLLSLITFVQLLYRFYKSYYGYEYNLFPVKDFLSFTYETYNLSEYYSTDELNSHIYNNMCKLFINNAIFNREQNNRKNINHKKLSTNIIKSVILVMFSYAIWILVINKYIF
jgi:hypothetical protein